MKDVYVWGIPSAAYFLWILLVVIFIPVLIGHLKRRTERSRPSFNEIILSALKIPLILFLIGIGYTFYSNAVPSLPKVWTRYSEAFLIVLFVLAGYLFFDRFMIEVLRRYSKRVDLIDSSVGAIKALYRIIILGFVFLIILDRLNITITPFLASLGIGGLVVALALQDTLNNFFSGIYIFIDKPVRIGDFISLGQDADGYVSQIGWRSTRIKMLSNNILIVPNTKLINSQIINFNLPEVEMGFSVKVEVSYRNDLEKVERVTLEAAKEVLRESAGSVPGFEPSLQYNAFGDSGITFSVNLRAREYADRFQIIHDFIKRVHKRYQQEGIEPFPIRTFSVNNEPRKPESSQTAVRGSQ